jgi:hypothetical protein
MAIIGIIRKLLETVYSMGTPSALEITTVSGVELSKNLGSCTVPVMRIATPIKETIRTITSILATGTLIKK